MWQEVTTKKDIWSISEKRSLSISRRVLSSPYVRCSCCSGKILFTVVLASYCTLMHACLLYACCLAFWRVRACACAYACACVCGRMLQWFVQSIFNRNIAGSIPAEYDHTHLSSPFLYLGGYQQPNVYVCVYVMEKRREIRPPRINSLFRVP